MHSGSLLQLSEYRGELAYLYLTVIHALVPDLKDCGLTFPVLCKGYEINR